MNNETTTHNADNIQPAELREDLPLTEAASEPTDLKRNARSAETANGADRQKPRGTGLDGLGGGNLLFEED
jgi:hypothetical protein